MPNHLIRKAARCSSTASGSTAHPTNKVPKNWESANRTARNVIPLAVTVLACAGRLPDNRVLG